MICEDVRRTLAQEPRSYGPESAEAREALDHCETCAPCRAYLALGRRLATHVRVAVASSTTIEIRLLARIRDALDTEDRRRSRARRRRVAAAGALTVTVSVLTVSLARSRLDDARPLAQFASSIGEHLELQSSDPGNVGRWLESRLGYEVEIPPIPGARLTGGRVVTLDGENLAAVTYVVGGKPLVYFAIPTGTLPGWEVSDRAVQTARIGRYHVATWIVDGTGGAIVAPMPKRDVQAVAEECRDAGGPDP